MRHIKTDLSRYNRGFLAKQFSVSEETVRLWVAAKGIPLKYVQEYIDLIKMS